MQQLDIQVRARSANEALNLGLMLARRYYFSLLFTALCPWFLLCVLSACLWYQTHSPLLALLVLWWFKPVYERQMLLRLSRLIFRQAVDWRLEQKSAKSQGYWAEITYLRPFRSFAPIRHAINCLEGLRGKERRERLRFFARGAEGSGRVLYLVCFLETAALLLLIWFLFDFSWENLEAFKDHLLYAPQTLHMGLWLSYALISLLITPFYIGAGFMIYLNFRIISEGWAVALDLQGLAARLGQYVLVLALGLLLMAPPNAYALDAQQASQDKAWVQAEVQGSNGPYAQIPAKSDKTQNENMLDLKFSKLNFSQAVKFTLIICATLWLLYLLVQIAAGRGFSFAKPRKAKLETADIDFDSSPQTLADLSDVQQLSQQGRFLEAVALIYAHWRKSLQTHRLPAMENAESENEYFLRVQSQLSAKQSQFLQGLFALWQQGAYAQKALDKQAVLHLLADYQHLWQQQ